MIRRGGRAALAAMLAGLALAGCGGGQAPRIGDAKQDATTQTQTSAVATKDAPAGSAASALRSRLVALGLEETYQTAIAASAGLVNGFGSPGFDAAARTARSTSRTLADTYASAAQAPLKSAYRTVWRASTQALLHAAAGQPDAAAELRRAEADRETKLLTLSPRLDGRAVAASRRTQLAGLQRAIDAFRHASPDAYADLVAAGAAVPAAAAREAAATAQSHPQDDAGSATSAAAALRAELTSDLISHVHLAALALDAERRRGRSSPAAVAAHALLSRVDGRLDASIVADDGREGWAGLVSGLDSYGRLLADHDPTSAKAELSSLHQAGKRLGSHFGSKGMFAPFVDSDAALVRADLADSPRVFDRIADAAKEMPGLAERLADAIAADDPARFPPR